jgi:dolichol-phosphate mannosyltransferase
VPLTTDPLVSVVCFAYNEARNLPVLYDRLQTIMSGLGVRWEWVVVDDHSTDGSFETVSAIAARDPRVRGIRLSRNFGAHSAKACGLHHASGDCAVVMAADLQDPPDVIPSLVQKWRAGAQIVSAIRTRRLGERPTTVGLSRVYHWLLRTVFGMKEVPSAGNSFCLLDRRVLDAFAQFEESHVPVTVLINWMGFRHEHVPYEQQARLYGRSGWTLEKKLKLLVDSITSFTYRPIRFMSYAGMIFATVGFVYAIRVIYVAFAGSPVRGWASLMVVVLVVGGLQMMMLGVLGEYLWRALSEAQRRPRYLVEDTVGSVTRYSVSAPTADSASR